MYTVGLRMITHCTVPVVSRGRPGSPWLWRRTDAGRRTPSGGSLSPVCTEVQPSRAYPAHQQNIYHWLHLTIRSNLAIGNIQFAGN